MKNRNAAKNKSTRSLGVRIFTLLLAILLGLGSLTFVIVFLFGLIF